jgi:hypothetical protein
MNRDEAFDLLIGARHHCFVRGVLGDRSFDRVLDKKPEDDFRAAFRELNRLYVELRHRPESTYIVPKSPTTKRNLALGAWPRHAPSRDARGCTHV